jgi:hypothetical protein
LGIIGGCLSHQPGMPPNSLYHRQLAVMLRPEGIDFGVSIARGFELSYRERLDSLMRKQPVEAVLLHLRIVVVEEIALFDNRLANGRRHYFLNPALSGRTSAELEREVAESQAGLFQLEEPSPTMKAPPRKDFSVPPPAKRVGRLGLRELNLAAGFVLGLDRRAITKQLSLFEELRSSCAERNLPLIVLGPTPTTRFRQMTRFWQKYNRALKDYFRPSGLRPILLKSTLTDDGEPMLLGDGLHLTHAGHRQVARQLYQPILEVLGKNQPAIVADSPAY